MNIRFNIEKSQRKVLAQKISELTGSEVKYLGVPSCGYQIGAYTLDKEAVLHGDELPDDIRSELQKAGYCVSCRHNSIVVDLDFRIKLYTVNNLLLLVERYLAKLTPITDDLNTASGSATESIAEMRKLLVLLDDTLVYNDTILSQLQSFCAEMKSAGDTMLTGLDAIENALSLIEGGLSVPDTTQLRSDTEKLLASLVQLLKRRIVYIFPTLILFCI